MVYRRPAAEGSHSRTRTWKLFDAGGRPSTLAEGPAIPTAALAAIMVVPSVIKICGRDCAVVHVTDAWSVLPAVALEMLVVFTPPVPHWPVRAGALAAAPVSVSERSVTVPGGGGVVVCGHVPARQTGRHTPARQIRAKVLKRDKFNIVYAP